MSTGEKKTSVFKGPLGFIIRFAVTAGLCALFIRQLELDDVRQALLNVDVGLVGAAVLLNLLSQLISAARWRLLSTALGFEGSYARFALWYFEGMFFSLCLPTSIGGDVVKAIRLAAQGSQHTRSIASVFADRLCGFAALVSIAAVGFAAHRWQWSAIVTLAVAAPSFAVAAFAFGRFVALGLGLFANQLQSMVEKLAPYREQPGTLTACVVISFIVQGLNAATVAVLGAAMGLDAPFSAYAVAVPVVSLLATLPISLGGLGVRENGLGYFLGLYGVEFADGVTLSLLWSAVIIVLGLTGGVAFLFTRSSATKRRGADSEDKSNDEPNNNEALERAAS